MSRWGKISLSLIAFQMMRVISSPSISTTVPLTLILRMGSPAGAASRAPYSTARRPRKAANPAPLANPRQGRAFSARWLRPRRGDRQLPGGFFGHDVGMGKDGSGGGAVDMGALSALAR